MIEKRIVSPMSNDLSLIDVKKPKTAEPAEIDGLVKFILAVLLAAMVFFFQKGLSFGLLSVYLLLLTMFSRIKPRTLIISASSYFIIVLMPYLFGFFVNGAMYSLTGNNLFALNQGFYGIFVRLFRLLIIWYVSILYFHTTPMKTVLGLLDKLLTPLKFVGLPIDDYLKVVMCTVMELKETGTEIKKSLQESMHAALGGDGRKYKINIKGLSQIIVSLIVNSFEKIDRIQTIVERTKPDDLYDSYSFRLSKKEIIMLFSFAVLAFLVLIVEKGYSL